MNAIATAAIVVSLFAAVGAITGLYVLVVIVLRACIRPESVDASGADDGNRSRLRLPRPAEAMWPRDKANTTRAERHDDAGTNV